jgi:hypothetical protein
MTRLLTFTALFVAALGAPTTAQVHLYPTAPPIVTAENERWYLSGEPLTFAGNLYYLAGPPIHFNGNEMVRSGSHLGIPLYTRTTIEPYSIVFVPIDGGRMQPYERRRTGELVGTSGSTISALPAVIPTFIDRPDPWIQAPAPPVVGSRPRDESFVQPGSLRRAQPSQPPTARGAERQPGRLEHASSPPPVRPGAANAMFMEFDNARWFVNGPPVLLDTGRLTRIGQHDGFPVYTSRNTLNPAIYVPVAQGMDALARFSKRKPSRGR